jgi:predicted glycogen debranching enzyme
MIEWGREINGDFRAAERREWLCANGIGGYASGTVAGSLTRRYHGLLVAALEPPLGRTLLVAKVDESVAYEGAAYSLASNCWAGGAIDPQGYLMERFALDGTRPVWTYAVADALVEKRVWMEPAPTRPTSATASFARACLSVFS